MLPSALVGGIDIDYDGRSWRVLESFQEVRAMALQPGVRAPDALLTDGDSRSGVALSDFIGERPLVLLFFPLAFSSTCTAEICAVAEDYDAYLEHGAQVIGISVDSPYTNARFAAETRAPFPILSDFNKTAARAYDVLRETLGHLQGVSERAAFVIDTDGMIKYSWVGEHPGVFPPLEEIKGWVGG
jgi:glutaredoxin-dependent peroxiredoxin